MTLPKLKIVQTEKISAEAVIVLRVLKNDSRVQLAKTRFSSEIFPESAFATDFSSIGASTDAQTVTTTIITDSNGASRTVALLGADTKLSAYASFREGYRELGGGVSRQLGNHKSLIVDLEISDIGDLANFTEGLLLGAHEPQSLKTSKSKFKLTSITIISGLQLPKQSIQRATILAKAVHATRDLTNLPANLLHPSDLAKVAVAAAAPLEAISVEVLEEKKLKAQRFGGILAVGAGANHGPRLVHLSYRPRGAKKHLALVGKGITFDTGGLSLKPAGSMLGMKYDMTGSAVVLQSIIAIANLGVKINADAWMCLAENMPSGSATRPNDVITLRNGKTVEVINTDAEGRIVLADGLSVASESKPDLIIDVATLTGAVTVALGDRTAGLLGNALAVNLVEEAAISAGEPVWVLPMPLELKASLSSDIADQANAKYGASGGTILGAWFLSEFVGDDASGNPIPWAHLDIAGAANNESAAYGFTPKGGTGSTVRTIVTVAESMSSN